MNKAYYHGNITTSGAFHLAIFEYVRKKNTTELKIY